NLPESLLESELFGVLAGAHSTADRDRPGRVAAASGGTLFLDEIGELSLGTQAKLLQLLQSKEYFPLGAIQQRKADVRIIAATNANLDELVREKQFREDLYYRLNVVPIRVPTLSERKNDIVPLAEHFLADAARRDALPILELSPSARIALEL